MAEGVTLSVPIIEEDLLAAAPHRQQHLDPEVYLADPPLDSSASLEVGPASTLRHVALLHHAQE